MGDHRDEMARREAEQQATAGQGCGKALGIGILVVAVLVVLVVVMGDTGPSGPVDECVDRLLKLARETGQRPGNVRAACEQLYSQ